MLPSSAIPRSIEAICVVALDAVADLRASSAYRRACRRGDLVPLAGGVESFARELADRLQHPEPVALPSGCTSALSTSDSSSSRRPAGIGADGLDVRDRAAAGEHRQAPEQPLLRLGRGASGSSRSSRAASAAARGCRGEPEVSTSSAWSRRSSSASGDSSRSRAAASSSASGRPSRRRQTAATRLRSRRQLERASRARARSTNSATAETRARAARAAYSRSAAILSGVLLVVTIRSAGQRSISRATSGRRRRPARGCRGAGAPSCRR